MKSVAAALVVIFLFESNVSATVPRTFPKRVGGPAVTFDAASASATAATPNAAVYFAGVALGGAKYELIVTRPSARVMADGEGNASFAPQGGIEKRAIWIAVDGATGGYTVAAPPGMLLREMLDFPGRGLEQNAAGALRRIALGRYNVDIFLVRPDAGIWGGNVRDGGRGDDDGNMNGAIQADLAVLAPLAGSGPVPERIEPGDVLFLVDRNTLEFHVARQGR